ncbi:MAG: glycosyltransferase family 4 protein [Candidatus Geothermarchaeales archaeon]
MTGSSILFVTTNRYGEIPGGIESFLSSTTTWMASRGMEPLVVHAALSSPRLVKVSGPFSPPSAPTSISRVVSLPLPVHVFVMSILAFLCTIAAARTGRLRRGSLVHGQDLSFAGLASVAAGYLLRVPVVLHYHGPYIYLIMDRPALLRGLEILINKLATRAADLVVVTDRLSQSYLERIGVNNRKIVKIPNAASLPMASATSNAGDFRVAYVGRVSPKKNLGVLLKAFQMASDAIGEGARLLIVGDGPCLGRLKELAHRLGIGGSTLFIGSRWDIQNILSNVDVFVLPSLVEGSPLSVLEAMSAGVPTVVSDVPGVREIITHDRTGLLVPPRSAQGFADAMVAIYRDPAKAQALSQAAREHVKRFHDPEAVFPRLLEVYHRATNAKVRGDPVAHL